MSNATAGFLAAFFSSFTLCPTELIKVQMQAARELEMTGPSKKTSQVLSHMYYSHFCSFGVEGWLFYLQ